MANNISKVEKPDLDFENFSSMDLWRVNLPLGVNDDFPKIDRLNR